VKGNVGKYAYVCVCVHVCTCTCAHILAYLCDWETICIRSLLGWQSMSTRMGQTCMLRAVFGVPRNKG